MKATKSRKSVKAQVKVREPRILVHLMVEKPVKFNPDAKPWDKLPTPERYLLCHEEDPTALCAAWSDEVTCKKCLALVAPGTKHRGSYRKAFCAQCQKVKNFMIGSREVVCQACKKHNQPRDYTDATQDPQEVSTDFEDAQKLLENN